MAVLSVYGHSRAGECSVQSDELVGARDAVGETVFACPDMSIEAARNAHGHVASQRVGVQHIISLQVRFFACDNIHGIMG